MLGVIHKNLGGGIRVIDNLWNAIARAERTPFRTASVSAIDPELKRIERENYHEKRSAKNKTTRPRK
jgi:DNA-binding PadR family transcriptional regulator